MGPEIDFLAAIKRESARFAKCLSQASPTDRVPSCPDWTAADLLWHLTEVQLFWGFIVCDRLDNPDAAEAEKPPRPTDYGALQALAVEATSQLLDVLATTPSTTPVWTWADDHSAGFVLRRQAHEALIHRLDAELTIDSVTPLDPALAADGVDEALRIMYGTAPPWGTLTPEGVRGRVEATDASMSWQMELGRFRGTSPNTGKTYDEGMLIVTGTTNAADDFSVAGTAADLDRFLWGRGDLGSLQTAGDQTALDSFAAIVAAGVQ